MGEWYTIGLQTGKKVTEAVLDDVTKETEDGVYEYQGLKIWLNREVN